MTGGFHANTHFEDAQVNFGEFLLVWDMLFKTFYDSANQPGSNDVGLRDRRYPTRYIDQLAEPFRGKA